MRNLYFPPITAGLFMRFLFIEAFTLALDIGLLVDGVAIQPLPPNELSNPKSPAANGDPRNVRRP
jgi:hypothetical protein